MPREFSIDFRRPNIVNLVVPKSEPEAAIYGSDTGLTVDTSVNDTLRIRADAGDAYTVIAVTSGATEDKVTIRDDLNAGFVSNDLPFEALIVGTNQIKIIATGDNTYLDIDLFANGSTLNTPLGFTDGATIDGAEVIVEYRFAAAANFDDTFVNIQDVPVRGFRSATVVDNSFNDGRFRGTTRFLFNPVDYSLTDNAPFYLRMAKRPLGGVFSAFGAAHMVVPYDPSSDPPIVMNGDAPSGTTVYSSQEIQLPRNTDEVVLRNLAGVNLHIAFAPNGPEFQLSTMATDLQISDTTISQIFVRGEGGTATFNAIFALQNSSMK
jgi:hypothetical protein